MLAENALLLMRSRYAAYSLDFANYIIDTTHPTNPYYTKNRKKWMQDIIFFSQNTEFSGLEILQFIDGENAATVVFTASLQQGGKDTSFTEESKFVKERGRWFYLLGSMISF